MIVTLWKKSWNPLVETCIAHRSIDPDRSRIDIDRYSRIDLYGKVRCGKDRSRIAPDRSRSFRIAPDRSLARMTKTLQNVALQGDMRKLFVFTQYFAYTEGKQKKTMVCVFCWRHWVSEAKAVWTRRLLRAVAPAFPEGRFSHCRTRCTSLGIFGIARLSKFSYACHTK